MMRRILRVEIQTPLNSEKGTRQLGNGEKDDILVCDSKSIVWIIRNSKSWLDACIQPALGGMLEISIDAKKKETIWKNPKQNKTKQKHNTLTSLLKNPEGFVLFPEAKLSFSKTKLWQIQTALKNSFQGFADSWSKSKIYSTQLSNKLPCAAAWLEEQLGFPEFFLGFNVLERFFNVFIRCAVFGDTPVDFRLPSWTIVSVQSPTERMESVLRDSISETRRIMFLGSWKGIDAGRGQAAAKASTLQMVSRGECQGVSTSTQRHLSFGRNSVSMLFPLSIKNFQRSERYNNRIATSSIFGILFFFESLASEVLHMLVLV